MSITRETSASTSYYAQINELEQKWLEVADTLPEERREECKQKVKEMSNVIIGKIRKFYFLGDMGILQGKIDRWKVTFDTAATRVCLGKETHSQERKALKAELDRVDEALKRPLGDLFLIP